MNNLPSRKSEKAGIYTAWTGSLWILGFTTLALFVDGLLRLLGIIPPFMEIDIDLLDKVVEKVEADVIDKIRQVPIQKILQSGFR